ncbi:MAG: hypothetical protein ACKVZJ_06710 [Phycisphaerales bacterium]
MRVKCRTNSVNESRHALTLGGAYEVIGIEAGDLRIIDDAGSPVLFDPALFDMIDPARPMHWKSWTDDGVEYAYAPELAAPGFFEDYHQRQPDAVRTFHRYINRNLRLSDAA